MTLNRRQIDISTLEDSIILKFNSDLLNAEVIELILQEEKTAQCFATPWTSSIGGTSSPNTGGDFIYNEEDAEEEN